MKKSIGFIICLVAALPFLVQCASQRDVAELRYQLRIVNKKLEDMKSSTVDSLQKRQAAATGQMDQLEKEILEFKSQLEETYHLNQRLKEENKELQASISNVVQEEAAKRDDALRRVEDLQRQKEAELAQLTEKLNAQQASVKAIQEARLKDAERKAKEASLNAELAKKRTQAVSPTAQTGDKSSGQIQSDKKKVIMKKEGLATPVQEKSKTPPIGAAPTATAEKPEQASSESAPPAAINEQPDNTFKKAQALFEKNSFGEALPLFEQIAANSSASEGVDARYMMGECLFNQKEYDKAIMQYQKIISQHSSHAKAPAAMLKQGMAFEKLADKETAKVIYKKLLKKHASAPEAAKAQEHLGKL
jgi:tol-pal system protein YbgF